MTEANEHYLQNSGGEEEFLEHGRESFRGEGVKLTFQGLALGLGQSLNQGFGGVTRPCRTGTTVYDQSWYRDGFPSVKW